MDEISPELVNARVREFWNILTGACRDPIGDLYSAHAIVFTGRARRSETARIVSARRMRQLANATSSANAELGSVEVQIAGPGVAIATYTYKFNSSKKQGDGSQVRKNTLFGRATQIFLAGEDGALRIVHEHLSAAAPTRVEKSVRP
jgi:ketosteroid isomerase-like protein